MNKVVNKVAYGFDTTLSLFTVHVFADGIVASLGHSPTLAIREYSGEAEFIPGSLENASLKLEIAAGSINVTDQMRDADRRELERIMRQDVLQTAKYPQIVFQSSSITADLRAKDQYRLKVTGPLTIRGETCQQGFTADLMFGVDTFRANGEFQIHLTDFGLPLVSVAGGSIKVKDELKLAFYMLGRRQ